MHLSSGSVAREVEDAELPTVSVVVPFFNQFAYVEQALDSVLAQNYPKLEIIVVDDGSSGDSIDWVLRKGSGCKVMRQENAGPAAARNAGIRSAVGEVIAFIDSDDIWPVNKLKNQMYPMVKDDSIDVIMGKLRKLRRLPEDAGLFQLEGESFYSLQLGCMLVRRRVFDSIGLFDETLRYSEDQDWFLRARESEVSIVKLDMEGLYYRCHGESLTRRVERKSDFGLIQVLKRSLNRRRDGGGAARELLSLKSIREWKAAG